MSLLLRKFLSLPFLFLGLLLSIVLDNIVEMP